MYHKHFPKDPQFSEKIPDLIEPLAWMLLERLKYRKSTVFEPDRVTQATNTYRKNNDIFHQYISERIIDDPEGTITLMDFFIDFRNWHRDSLPGFTTPTKNEAQEYLQKSKVWGKMEIGYKWKGRRFRKMQDDIAEGKADLIPDNEIVNYDDPKSPINNENSKPDL